MNKTDKIPSLIALFIIPLGVPIDLYSSFAFMMMWKWFLIPLGLPAVKLVHAYGLIVFKGFLINKGTCEPLTWKILLDGTSFRILNATVCLGMAYLIHRCL